MRNTRCTWPSAWRCLPQVAHPRLLGSRRAGVEGSPGSAREISHELRSDLVLAKGNEKFLVQCKQWKAFKVGVQIVRELYGVMAAKGAAGGFVVTSGRFTEEATAFASGRNVTLVDGPKLFRMIQMAQASIGGAEAAGAPRRVPEEPVRAAPVSAPMQSTRAPTASPALACPVCSRAMTLRTAKRGANAGGTFWGCTGYPSCRGVRPSP